MTNDEIMPPWIVYPDFPPGDPFWNQSGEAWFYYVWEPYWKSLSQEEQEAYLKRFSVPQEWQDFYFDPSYQEFLESIDEDEL